MNIEAKPRTVIIAVLIIAVLVGGYFYREKTAPERKYKWEIKQLRLMSEHQGLEIEVIKQGKELSVLKAELERKKPVYKLTPEDPNQ